MNMKAQIEIFVLLGLIFLGIVVLYFFFLGATYTSPSGPIGISQREATIRKPVSDMFVAAAKSALEEISIHGGYSPYVVGDYTGLPTAKVGGFKVLSWWQCQNDYSPAFSDIQSNVRSYIEKYINEKLDTVLESSYYAVDYDLDDLVVDVSFTDAAMVVDITMPISVDDQALAPQYMINLPTKLRKIYDFAKDLTKEQTTNRNLETFTTTAMYFSKEIETKGVLVECGEVIIHTPDMIAQATRNSALYVLGNDKWWMKKTTDPNPSEYPQFYFDEINGKTYPDIRPQLSFTDDNEFLSFESVFLINSDWIFISPPFIMPICMKYYDLRYDVMYPVAVMVSDSLSGNTFRFTGLVFVDGNYDNEGGMIPGECDLVDFDYAEIGMEDICHCTTGERHAKLRVLGRENDPLTDAHVSFGMCGLEHTDNGYYEGEIGCEDGTLVIYKSGYEPYIEEDKDGDTLSPSGATPDYRIHWIPDITVDFHEMETLENFRLTYNCDHGMDNTKYVDYGACYTGPYPSYPTPAGSGCSSGADRPGTSLSRECVMNDPKDVFMVTLKRSDGVEYMVVPNLDSDILEGCFTDELREKLESCDDRHCMQDALDDLAACAEHGMLPEVLVDYIPGGYTYTMVAELKSFPYYYTVGYSESEPFYLNEDDPGELDIYVPTRGVPFPDALDEDGNYELSDGDKTCLMGWLNNECGVSSPVEQGGS